jgi:hypothetical protein
MKSWVKLQPPNSNCFKTITSGNENHGNETLIKLLLEIRFPFSYLDSKWSPFPNPLS